MATNKNHGKHQGYTVEEGTLQGASVTVVIAHIHIETRWSCPNPDCKTRWRKPGRHHGTHHKCKKCGHTFWLRPG
jgi:predicted RNA-binding Zn-ribbon protein involved in translation (DUF1610 family)